MLHNMALQFLLYSYIYKHCVYLELSTQEDKEMKISKQSWWPVAKKETTKKKKHSENV